VVESLRQLVDVIGVVTVRIVGKFRGIPTGRVCPPIRLELTFFDFDRPSHTMSLPAAKRVSRGLLGRDYTRGVGPSCVRWELEDARAPTSACE